MAILRAFFYGLLLCCVLLSAVHANERVLLTYTGDDVTFHFPAWDAVPLNAPHLLSLEHRGEDEDMTLLVFRKHVGDVDPRGCLQSARHRLAGLFHAMRRSS